MINLKNSPVIIACSKDILTPFMETISERQKTGIKLFGGYIGGFTWCSFSAIPCLNFDDSLLENIDTDFVFVPLTEEILEKCFRKKLKVMCAVSNIRKKYEFFKRAICTPVTTFNACDRKDFDQSFHEACVDAFVNWDKDHLAYEHLMIRFNISGNDQAIVEVDDSVLNHFIYDIGFCNVSKPQMVEVSDKDIYDENKFPPDNILDKIKWLEDIIKDIPSEHVHTAEIEEQEDSIYITYKRPETEEEMRNRIEEAYQSSKRYYDDFMERVVNVFKAYVTKRKN